MTSRLAKCRLVAGLGLALAVGMVFGASVQLGQSADQPAAKPTPPIESFSDVDIVRVGRDDPLLALLSERVKDPALLFVFSASEERIKVVAVEGKSQIIVGEVTIPAGSELRMASASVLRFRQNPECTWVKFDGTSILVPANCTSAN